MTMMAATCLLAVSLGAGGRAAASTADQKQTDADRAASLVVRWQQIVYPAFEDGRASIDEENTDHLNALLSQGAVRAVHDRADAVRLKSIDDGVRRLAAAVLRSARRQPGGSLIIDADAFEAGLDAVCPLYPFCER
jgi:hypothetical protein